ncbi:hypothetical protein EHP00_1483 [Ecytonucleospora hepatopenaei]|uniref:Uncharacterized protein n=1 Tax=Ecytonucleospora hepatopenaei TaxID=646526 RepID=A0A1W0E8T5_9MICR|nr:hypothetical protein EHP00_1483 [Ecytonucleospora hepatopenaei]
MMYLHLLSILGFNPPNLFSDDCPTCQKNYQKTGKKLPPSDQSVSEESNAPPEGTEEYNRMRDDAAKQVLAIEKLKDEQADAEIKASEAKAKKIADQLHALTHKQKKLNKHLSEHTKHEVHYEYKQPVSVAVFTPASIPFKAHQLLALNHINATRKELADALNADEMVIRTISTSKELPLVENGHLNVPTNPHTSAVHKGPITYKYTETQIID